MTYELHYYLDVYEYEYVDGTRANTPIRDSRGVSGTWELYDEEFTVDHVRSLMMDVFNQFIKSHPMDVQDRFVNYVVDNLVENETVMVEYDMCVGVIRGDDPTGEEITLNQYDGFYDMFKIYG